MANVDTFMSSKTTDLNDKLFLHLNNLFKAMAFLSKGTKFVHNDAHLGNVLYDFKKDRFFLIDYGRSYIDLTDKSLIENLKNIEKSNEMKIDNFWKSIPNRFRIEPKSNLLVPALCDIASLSYQVYRKKSKYLNLLTSNRFNQLLKIDFKSGVTLTISKKDRILQNVKDIMDSLPEDKKDNYVLFVYGLAWFVEYIQAVLEYKSISKQCNSIVTHESENWDVIVASKNVFFAEQDDLDSPKEVNIPFIKAACGIFFAPVFNKVQHKLINSNIQKAVVRYITPINGGGNILQQSEAILEPYNNSQRTTDLDIEKLAEDMVSFDDIAHELYNTNMEYGVYVSKKIVAGNANIFVDNSVANQQIQQKSTSLGVSTSRQNPSLWSSASADPIAVPIAVAAGGSKQKKKTTVKKPKKQTPAKTKRT